MTMADRNIREQKTSAQETIDAQDITSQRRSPQVTSARLRYHSDNDIDILDLRSSTSDRQPGLSTRDSGYGTDLSPAMTSSPAANTLRQQHFTYGGIGHRAVPEDKNRTSADDPNLPSPQPATIDPINTDPIKIDPINIDPINIDPINTDPINTDPINIDLINIECHGDQVGVTRSSAHPTPISPLSTSRKNRIYPITYVPSPPLSESSDTNRVQFDFDSDDEDTRKETQRRNVTKTNQFIPTSRNFSTTNQFIPTSNARQRFDLSGNLIRLNLYDEELDEDDEDDTFYKNKDESDNLDAVSESYIPRRRRKRRSQSLRLRRNCSMDKCESGYSGACGGTDLNSDVPSFHRPQLQDENRCILLELTHARGCDVREFARSGSIEKNHPHLNDNIPFMDSLDAQNASLTGSQGFKPGYFDIDTRDIDCTNGVTTCVSDDEAMEDSHSISGASHAVPIRDWVANRSLSSSLQRRHGVTTNPLTDLECLPPWGTALGGVSVSTQTPHATSVMIQQILQAPVPNQARGTVASRLHRASVAGLPLPPGPTQLPDIITSVGRDRSQSVPNLQTLESRNTAREVGRELRRLSDEFNIRRSLTPVNEEFDGHPASFPRMQLRNSFHQFGALLRGTFRGRHNSFN